MKNSFLIIFFLLSTFYLSAQFGPQQDISKSVARAWNVEAFDLDGDGDLDVLSASFGDNKIAWYENLGGGNFGVQRIISTNAIGVRDVLAADLNNDGKLDVLSASTDDDKIAWYKNLGGGDFGVENIISKTVDVTSTVASADMDNDGDIDVIASSFSDATTVWFENLGGVIDTSKHLIAAIGAVGLTAVSTADIFGNGNMDVFIGGSSLRYSENLGGGTFNPSLWPSISVSGGGNYFATDMDNDGDVDVITGGTGSSLVYHENVGTNSFGIQLVPNTSGLAMFSIRAADMDGDGSKDIVCGIGSSTIAWFKNLGAGNFGVQQDITLGIMNGGSSIATADMDGDGDIDVLSSSEMDSRIAWYENLGSGIFGSQQAISKPVGGLANEVHSADLDNDGDMDVLAALVNAIAWYENVNGVLGDEQIISTNILHGINVSTADFDLDGDLDVLSVSVNDDKIAWYENFGGAVFGPQQIISTNSFPSCSFIADLDNDGDMDVVSGHQPGPSNLIWHENIGGSFNPPQTIDPLLNSITDVYAADLDNDGDQDVIIANSVVDLIGWYENLGAGTFSTLNVVSNIIESANSVHVADIDGDGFKDIISSSAGGVSKAVEWYRNFTNGNFSTPILISANSLTAQDVYTSDIDNDGDLDVLSTADYKLIWNENLGGGVISTTKNIVSSSLGDSLIGGSPSVFAADVDGDGSLDLLTSSYFDEKIAWYKNFHNSPYLLKGKMFYDGNQNASLDSTELGLAFIQAFLQPSNNYNYTSVPGDFLFATDTGTYVVNFTSQSLWSLTTDSTTYTKTLTGVNPVIDSLNFGFYPDTILTIINPDLVGGFPRCNQIINYWGSIHNKGTTIPSGIIHLQLDDSINYISSVNTPDSINGQNIYWHYDSLFFYSDTLINIQVQLPPFTSMGDTLTSLLSVFELDGANNVVYTKVDTLDQILVCAYDPNDKSVTPKGVGPLGYISQNQELEYLIRFQNTGNDTAITVMIRDQLDNDLDWSTLQPISNSHSVQVSITQSGEVVFKFENIMLPDSGVDFLGSKGFVKFSIQPKPGLLPNTPIYNNANIYFDNNPAVVTNTILNTIECYSTPQPVISYSFPYLNAGVTGNYTYQWYLNDTLIVGATSDTLTPLVSGGYTVEIIDSNTCTKVSNPFTHFMVGIEELRQIQTVVFPNPFNESTTILFDKNLNGDYDLQVYNIVGAHTKQVGKIVGNKVEIAKNDVGKGLFLVYLINRKTGEKMFVGKLVAQ